MTALYLILLSVVLILVVLSWFFTPKDTRPVTLFLKPAAVLLFLLLLWFLEPKEAPFYPRILLTALLGSSIIKDIKRIIALKKNTPPVY